MLIADLVLIKVKGNK